MYRYFLPLFLVLIGLSCKTQSLLHSQSNETSKQEEITVISVGQSPVNEAELNAYLIQNAFPDSIYKDSILTDFLWQKRYYLDAVAKGYGASRAQQDELGSYAKVLSKSFILDSSLVNPLMRLTYERLKRQIRASHILLAVSEDASPKDTMLIYNKIQDLRNLILNGANFDSLAKAHSADINTREKGGDMGWFSALQLIFSLENTAYNTGIGNISPPVRTNAGYHLIKVTDGRPSVGKLNVQHILKAIPKNADGVLESTQKASIDSIYKVLLDNSKNFGSLCEQFSDDGFSKHNEGFLSPFGVGEMEESFENVAFALKKNEISPPFKSSGGWHIIRLVEKIPMEPYNKLMEKLHYKVTTDSRGAYLEEIALAKLAEKLMIDENQKALNEVLIWANPRILSRNWKLNKASLKETTVLKIDKNSFSNYDFIDYAEEKQKFEKQRPDNTPEMYLRRFYRDFKKEKTSEAIEQNLKDWDPDFKRLMEIYEESILVNNYLNAELYEKSVSDTTGQRAYYEKHMATYTWPKKIKAAIIRTSSDSLLNEYKEIVQSGTPYRLKRGILPFHYQKNEATLSDELKRKLVGLSQIMDKNPGYIVEIGGHRDPNEAVEVSAKRIRAIVQYLIENGVPITRITEYDYGISKLIDPFDWPQNQRVTFQFFSRSKSDITKILHSEKHSVEIGYGYYAKGENEIIDRVDWEVGNYEATFENQYYRIEIEEVIPARIKNLREARGAVIADYQTEMKNQINTRLATQYPVNIDNKAVDAVFKNAAPHALKKK